jgi:guanosine-3',5'-bis(diphosphate) 3'-pyrophosphohydrolase
MIIKALNFASYAHKEQKRKYSDVPYIIHPVRIAERLREIGINDETILCAALLHDTLEDTSVDSKELENAFGNDVIMLVKQLTRDKKNENGYIDTSHIKDERAMIIKIMDRIDNMQDYNKNMGVSPEKYIFEAKLILHRAHEIEKNASYIHKPYLRKAIEMLDNEIDDSLSKLKEKNRNV